MKTFRQLTEELNDKQKAMVATWPKTTIKARVATDDFFGKGVDDKYTPLEGTVDKSEIHKRIERHLGKVIHSEDYKAGKTTDEHGREVKIGKLLAKTKADDDTKRGFENDSTRQAKTHKKLTVRTTRSAEGVAGQTSGNQSWEQQSCKNFDSGCNRHFLKPEVKHGTVVSYLHDENGKEIARCTHQPHHNDEGNTMYASDSYYGINHAGFKKHCEQVNKQLSGPHKGGSLAYTKHNKVYDDSGQSTAYHPDATSDDIDKALNNKDVKTKTAALSHPAVTSAHLDKALKDKDSDVRTAAAAHHNATSAHLDKALKDTKSFVRRAATEHPNATSAHLDKALKDTDPEVRRAATEHPNSTSAHLDKALKDTDPEVRTAAAAHPNATSAHLDKALKDTDFFVRKAATKHPNATSAHLDKALNDTDPEVRTEAAAHPNATSAHLNKALRDTKSIVRRAAAAHPNAKKFGLVEGISVKELFYNLNMAF